jgi:hypothetical protein
LYRLGGPNGVLSPGRLLWQTMQRCWNISPPCFTASVFAVSLLADADKQRATANSNTPGRISALNGCMRFKYDPRKSILPSLRNAQ